MRAKKVDANQPEIIEQAKALGISVQSLHEIGKGCPDVLFGYGGFNVLAEIKDGNNNLNDLQISYHSKWNGQVCTIRNIDDLVTEFLSISYGFYATINLLGLLNNYEEMKKNGNTGVGF